MNELITPGKWIFKEQGVADEFCIITDKNIWVAAFRLNGIQTIERQRANGKLMAASPDLLSSLEHVVKYNETVHDKYKISESLIDEIKNVIKKATE